MQRKTVLIVEDDYAIQENLKLAVELEGYQVLVAGNGKEALEQFARGPRPGLILLDLMMPLMDGFEFLAARKLDRQLSEIPVVIVSAFLEKAREVKAEGYIKKPIDLDELYRTISSLFRPTDAG